MKRLLLALSAAMLTGHLQVQADETSLNAPSGILVEAESAAAGEIIADNTASGGKAVTRQGDWQPLVALPLPAGDAFKIWVRHKGGPFALKSNTDSKTQDNWRWDKPDKWAWTDAGTYSRAALGEKLTIIRNNDKASALLIDMVVFTPAVIRVLPPFEPNGKLAPLTINASIDWNKKIGALTPLHWGTNDYEILNPINASDAAFQAALKQQNFALIRIHNGGFAEAWTDAKTRSWDIEKIKAGFAASTGYGDAKIMLNIAHWPKWLSKESVLTPAQEDEFAALVGQLPKIMRDIRQPITYWELTNEFDNTYEKAGKLDDLWRLFNKLARAVKQAEPQAKIGGPAFTWPKTQWIEAFLKNCGANIQFLTWHNYAVGDIYDSNETVFEKAKVIGEMAGAAQALARANNPQLETFLTELNVKWTWDPFERRHANNIGTLFVASAIKSVALSGTTGIAQWHVKGNAYGLIDGNNQMRPPAYLYLYSRDFLTGDIVQSQSDDEKLLELLPVIRADGKRSLLLLNKAPRTLKLPILSRLLPGAKSGWRIDAETIRHPERGPTPLENTLPAPNSFSLPGYSLTLLTD